ncbi:MAG: PrsW family intramembrane metalloprotease [Firmicutes bacterium]|nr:PrsW family intramembrane metalloprotease [Bacillota bacterium]
MIFFNPIMGILGIYVLAAVLPAFFLLRYIYKMDTIEKEPGYLLWALLLSGVWAALASIVLESLGSAVLNSTLSSDDPYYHIIFAFLVVAVVEEGTKLFFLKRRSWRDPNFNYMFDGMVYSVFVSLGFAAFENIKYVFAYGLSVAMPRALLAVPGHLGFAVFMGIFYGRAKLCECRGDSFGKKINMALGYVFAVFLHGFYDSCCMIGTKEATAVFVIFVIAMYFIVFHMVKKASRKDRPV